MNNKSSPLFDFRPLALPGYALFIIMALTGVVVGYGIISEGAQTMGLLIGFAFLGSGLGSLLILRIYLRVTIFNTTIIIQRWFQQEIIDKNDIQAIRFTAEDILLHTSRGPRKLTQFTRKRKDFVTALQVNAPQLASPLEGELQRGEKQRINQLKDGLIIAGAAFVMDWPLFLLIIYFVAIPPWLAVILLISPIPALLLFYWYYQRISRQLHTLPRTPADILPKRQNSIE